MSRVKLRRTAESVRILGGRSGSRGEVTMTVQGVRSSRSGETLRWSQIRLLRAVIAEPGSARRPLRMALTLEDRHGVLTVLDGTVGISRRQLLDVYAGVRSLGVVDDLLDFRLTDRAVPNQPNAATVSFFAPQSAAVTEQPPPRHWWYLPALVAALASVALSAWRIFGVDTSSSRAPTTSFDLHAIESYLPSTDSMRLPEVCLAWQPPADWDPDAPIVMVEVIGDGRAWFSGTALAEDAASWSDVRSRSPLLHRPHYEPGWFTLHDTDASTMVVRLIATSDEVVQPC